MLHRALSSAFTLQRIPLPHNMYSTRSVLCCTQLSPFTTTSLARPLTHASLCLHTFSHIPLRTLTPLSTRLFATNAPVTPLSPLTPPAPLTPHSTARKPPLLEDIIYRCSVTDVLRKGLYIFAFILLPSFSLAVAWYYTFNESPLKQHQERIIAAYRARTDDPAAAGHDEQLRDRDTSKKILCATVITGLAGFCIANALFNHRCVRSIGLLNDGRKVRFVTVNVFGKGTTYDLCIDSLLPPFPLLGTSTHNIVRLRTIADPLYGNRTFYCFPFPNHAPTHKHQLFTNLIKYNLFDGQPAIAAYRRS